MTVVARDSDMAVMVVQVVSWDSRLTCTKTPPGEQMQRAMTAGAFAGRPRPHTASMPARVVQVQQFLDDCVAMVQRAYIGVMRRAAVRRQLHQGTRDHQLDKARSTVYAEHSALMTVVQQMRRVYVAGATLDELLRFPEVLHDVAFELAGQAPRPLDHIDLDEERLSGLEDNLQMRRRVHGATPAGLREEREVATRLVTLNAERVRACSRLALSLEQQGIRA